MYVFLNHKKVRKSKSKSNNKMLSLTNANRFNSFDERKASFKNTPYDKCRSKCTSKKMADAGFYFTPGQVTTIDKENNNNSDEHDMVTCYACGIQLNNWNKKSDDPL